MADYVAFPSEITNTSPLGGGSSFANSSAGGESIVKDGATGVLKGIESSDASITVTGGANTVDLTVDATKLPSIASAGGESIVDDGSAATGYSLKGIESSDTSITVTGGASTVDLAVDTTKLPSIASAGGTSIVDDGTPSTGYVLKGIESSDGSVTVSSTATTIDLTGAGAGGGADLAATLAVGNVTGGNEILQSVGDFYGSVEDLYAHPLQKASSGAGYNLIVRGGNHTGPDDGGYGSLRGGDAVTGDGGDATVVGGHSSSGGKGGNVIVASGTGSSSGYVSIATQLSGGSGSNLSGSVVMETGEVINNVGLADSGHIRLSTGKVGTKDSGKITIATGEATGGSGTSGHVEIATGDALGGGYPGRILLETGQTNATNSTAHIYLKTGDAPNSNFNSQYIKLETGTCKDDKGPPIQLVTGAGTDSDGLLEIKAHALMTQSQITPTNSTTGNMICGSVTVNGGGSTTVSWAEGVGGTPTVQLTPVGVGLCAQPTVSGVNANQFTVYNHDVAQQIFYYHVICFN